MIVASGIAMQFGCTHMADVDYGGIRVYAGNYDDYMEASALALVD